MSRLRSVLLLLITGLFCAGAYSAEAPLAANPAAAPVSALPAEPVATLARTITVNGQPIDLTVDSLDNPLVLMQTTRGDLVIELFAKEAPQTVANFVGLATGTKPFIDPLTNSEVVRPFYDGLVFHRVVDGFMIQGGSPTGLGDGFPGYRFDDEMNAQSLGLDKMMVIDPAGNPNPVLGIRNQEDFQQRILLPLYDIMGITSQEVLDARISEVDQRVRNMSVLENYEMIGYRYINTVQSRAPVRGVIAMANSGPNTNGSQFFITLVDTPWLTGKHTVFGKVRAGLDVLDAMGNAPADADDRPYESIAILWLRPL